MRVSCSGVDCLERVAVPIAPHYVSRVLPPVPMWSVCATATLLLPFTVLRVIDAGDYATVTIEWFIGGREVLAKRLWSELVRSARLMVVNDEVVVEGIEWVAEPSITRIDLVYHSVWVPLKEISLVSLRMVNEELVGDKGVREMLASVGLEPGKVDEREAVEATAELIYNAGIGLTPCVQPA